MDEQKYYEDNLELHYEAKRKDLDIMLSSAIPTQSSTMKTIIWINLLLIGIVLHIYRENINIGLIEAILTLTLFSVLIIIYAMLIGNDKHYGSIDDIEYMSQIPQDKWERVQALLGSLTAVNMAIESNEKAMEKRAKLMKISTFLTFFTVFFILMLLTTIPTTKVTMNGDINMATNEKRPTKPIIKPTVRNIKSEDKKPTPSAKS